jgi:cytochrome o ubiquinol oxidase operon protein cyoD
MSDKLPQSASESRVTLRSYVAGFVLSLVLTVTAYTIVTQNSYSKRGIIAAVATLAMTQFVVQMLFFMHLGHESGPRWKLLALIFMAGVVLIIVLGSLWIMNHLDYNMMSPKDMQHYMDSQDGL